MGAQLLMIGILANVDRMDLLDLRDEIIEALAPLGVKLAMTDDGVNVTMYHAASVPNLFASEG